MIAALDQHEESPIQTVSVSFGVFKPEQGHDIDDAVAHMAVVAAALEHCRNINIAVLRSLDCKWVAALAVSRGISQSADKSALDLSEAAAFTRGLKCVVRIVDSGWFHLSSHQTSRGVPFVKLSLGDIVSVRRLHSSWKQQDVVSYSCLAILRSYFKCLRGLSSYSFYDSLDGKQIMGLGVWDSVESASVLKKYPDANPAMAYWAGLGVKKMEYDVFQVVYVTCTISIQNSGPGFRI